MRETPGGKPATMPTGSTRRDFLGTAGAAAIVPGFTILSARPKGPTIGSASASSAPADEPRPTWTSSTA